jgi:hypothetical protein
MTADEAEYFQMITWHVLRSPAEELKPASAQSGRRADSEESDDERAHGGLVRPYPGESVEQST